MQSSRPVVLVVEDDPVLADMLCDLLREAGYAADATRPAVRRSARIEAGQIDLVLLDLMLPDVDGLELCRRARAVENDVYLPIIMLTALSDKQRHAGFWPARTTYVAKPSTPATCWIACRCRSGRDCVCG